MVVDKATSDLWWKDAVIYCIDIKTWLDSNDDGWGDFPGATRRLDYLRNLGVNCLWLMPFYPSPLRDDGYDVSDYYTVHSRMGDLGDFVEFVRTANNLGMRVIIDMVLSHTSDQHPWFQRARHDRNSVYRDYYLWADEPPEFPAPPVFPGEQDSTWTFDEVAGQWYFHHYHYFMPDLNIANPRVRDEMNKIMGFWLELGVDGFRIDSVPFLLESLDAEHVTNPNDYLRDIRGFVSRRSGNAILLGEANVDPETQRGYFGEHGSDQMQMLLDFHTMTASWHGLTTGSAVGIREHLSARASLPANCQYATFLRCHDELNLDSLPLNYRKQVMELLDPYQQYRLYGRGVSRRLAPLLGGDERRVRCAFSLLLALPGTPVLFYGDEIGMADNLDLPGRLVARPLMQWSSSHHGGFSNADENDLVRPSLPGGQYGYRAINVATQQHDEASLLNWVRRAVQARRESPEVGWGEWEIVSVEDEHVLALFYTWQGGQVLTVHNFSPEPAKVTLPERFDERQMSVLLDGPDGADTPPAPSREFTLPGFGHRWFRLAHDGPDTGVT